MPIRVAGKKSLVVGDQQGAGRIRRTRGEPVRFQPDQHPLAVQRQGRVGRGVDEHQFATAQLVGHAVEEVDASLDQRPLVSRGAVDRRKRL